MSRHGRGRGLPSAIIGLGALGGRRRRASFVGMLAVAVVVLLVLAMATRGVPGQFLAGSEHHESQQAETEVFDATQTEELKERIGQRVTVEGTVSRAAWSRTGAVCNINFRNVERDGFLAAIFEGNRKAFDDAFGGDVAATIAGAKVRISGDLGEYRGRVEDFQGRPQIVLRRVQQLTIVELAGERDASRE